MATRRPGAVAAINRQIDAINAKGRRANPRIGAGDTVKFAPDVVKRANDPLWKTARGLVVRVDRSFAVVDFQGTWIPRDDGETIRSVPLANLVIDRNANPTRTATLVARKPAKNPGRKSAKLSQTEYEVQYSRDGETWHKWTAVLYEDMAKEIAARISKEFPKYHVRVIRRA